MAVMKHHVGIVKEVHGSSGHAGEQGDQLGPLRRTASVGVGKYARGTRRWLMSGPSSASSRIAEKCLLVMPGLGPGIDARPLDA